MEENKKNNKPLVLLILIVFALALILYDGRYLDHVYYITVLFISLWGIIAGLKELLDNLDKWALPSIISHIIGICLSVFVVVVFFYYFYRMIPSLARIVTVAAAIFSVIVIYLEFFRSPVRPSPEVKDTGTV